MTSPQQFQPAAADPPQVEVDPRVTFAAERTLLAWIRTGLALMGFGFVVARFGLFLRELASSRLDVAVPASPRGRVSQWVGVALVLLGVAVNVLGTVEYVRVLRRLTRGEVIRPKPLSLASALAVSLGAVGLFMAVYLVFLR